MSGEDFTKAYPKRLPVAFTKLLGVGIATEFAGINHNPSARGIPKIYETQVWVHYWEWHPAVTTRAFVTSTWAGGRYRALAVHVLTIAFAVLGGCLWWRLRAWVGSR